MRNLKRALSLAVASVMLLGMMVVGTSADFADVASAHNEEAIAVAQAAGIMIGDDQGNFNPDQKVTRNEMAVVMANMLGLNVADYAGTAPFSDVPAWAEPYVAACYANSIVSGTSATTYDGAANVTAAEASLMMMKALGYFQYAGDFGDDWKMATVKQASKIELTDGIEASANTALTRNEVAQLALNALEANTVDFTGTIGTDITTSDGTSITIGYRSEYTEQGTSYNYVVNGSSAHEQLVEKLYKEKLTKTSTTDDFQRPAHQWKWNNESIGKYADEADVTYTKKVTAKTIYNDLGLDADWSDANVYVNGASAGTVDVIKNDETDANKVGGAGTTTEVYVIKNDATGAIVRIDIVSIQTAYGKISSVGKNADDERIVRTGSKTYKTENFAKDDIVVYTWVGSEIKSMELVEAQTGKVTKTVGTDIYVDGTKYARNAVCSDEGDWAVGDDVTFYLNANGYVIRVEATEDTVSLDNLAYVESTGSDRGTYWAALRLADGTKMVVDTDDNYASLLGKIVSFKETDDGYELTNKTNDTEQRVAYTDDAVAMGTIALNSKTTFVYAINTDEDATIEDYKVYTGYKAAPSFSTADAVAYEDDDVAVLVYVFVDNDNITEALSELTLIVYDSDVKLTTVKDVATYYDYAAVVDGEVTTVKVGLSAWASVAGNGYGILTDSITTDTDGVAESIGNAISGSSNTVKVSNGVITIGSTPFAIADDAAAYLVSDEQAVSIIEVTDIEKDDNTVDYNPYVQVQYHLDSDGKVDTVVVYEG